MQLLTSITNLLLSLLSLALMSWVGWQSYVLLTKEQQAFVPEIQAALVIAAVILLICTFMITKAINKGSVRSSLGIQKASTYEQVLHCWLDQKLDDQQAFNALKISIALMGGHAVFEKINTLEAVTIKEGYSSEKAMATFKALVMVMRQDLGLSTNFSGHKELDELLF